MKKITVDLLKFLVMLPLIIIVEALVLLKSLLFPDKNHCPYCGTMNISVVDNGDYKRQSCNICKRYF